MRRVDRPDFLSGRGPALSGVARTMSQGCGYLVANKRKRVLSQGVTIDHHATGCPGPWFEFLSRADRGRRSGGQAGRGRPGQADAPDRRGDLPDGSISSAARKSAFRALAELLPVIESHRPDAVHAVATAAVRDATNGNAFVAGVRSRFGLNVRVISGDEEARLSYAGARAQLGAELGRATLFDLGGGSLEAIVGDGQEILHTATAPLGVLRAVVERPLSDPPAPRELRALEQWAHDAAARFIASLGDIDLGRIILCAGTARAVRSVGPRARLHPDGGHGSRSGRTRHASLLDRSARRRCRWRRGGTRPAWIRSAPI